MAFEIYLVQHGKALPEEQDPEEALSNQGKEEICRSAQGLKHLQELPEVIFSSPKKRAKQTAEIFSKALAVLDILDTELLKAKAAPEESLKALLKMTKKKKWLVCGHLPSLQAIASFLLVKNEKVFIDIQNGACLKIMTEDPLASSGRLMWYLLSSQLGLLGGKDAL